MNHSTVLYVARKVNAPRFYRAFLESLIHHPSGADFQLLYVMKGYAPDEQDQVQESVRSQHPCSVETVGCSDVVSPSLVYIKLGQTRPIEKLDPLRGLIFNDASLPSSPRAHQLRWPNMRVLIIRVDNRISA